jgi:hypothetical protein
MREKKRGEGGGLWLFIASLALRRGLGLREGEEIDGQGGVRRGQGTGWRKRATLTGEPQASVAEKVTDSGSGDTGPWAPSQAGPNRSPAAFSSFPISFPFFFF